MSHSSMSHPTEQSDYLAIIFWYLLLFVVCLRMVYVFDKIQVAWSRAKYKNKIDAQANVRIGAQDESQVAPPRICGAPLHKNIQLVSIDGNIGSGKTTIMTALKARFESDPHVIILDEPLTEWLSIRDSHKNILEYFYEDQVRHAFAFQMMAYISRLAILHEAVATIYRADPEMKHKWTIISERSLFTDKCVFVEMLWAQCKLSEIEHQIYLKWFQSFVITTPISSIIYIRASASTCASRIVHRNRHGEEGIPIEYLQECNIYHEQYIDAMREYARANIHILDGNIDIGTDPTILDDWVHTICGIIF